MNEEMFKQLMSFLETAAGAAGEVARVGFGYAVRRELTGAAIYLALAILAMVLGAFFASFSARRIPGHREEWTWECGVISGVVVTVLGILAAAQQLLILLNPEWFAAWRIISLIRGE